MLGLVVIIVIVKDVMIVGYKFCVYDRFQLIFGMKYEFGNINNFVMVYSNVLRSRIEIIWCWKVFYENF